MRATVLSDPAPSNLSIELAEQRELVRQLRGSRARLQRLRSRLGDGDGGVHHKRLPDLVVRVARRARSDERPYAQDIAVPG